MAGIFNFNWAQGEDLDIELVYKKGDPTPVAVDLTGYTLRMDIGEYGKTPEFTIVSPDANITLNADTTNGKIRVKLNRSVLLPPAEGQEANNLYDKITGFPGLTTFSYDLFLRDGGGKTYKVLGGEIYVERSVTLWT